MTRPALDERHRRILTFVVESHVSSAEPVGSQYVRAAYHLSISPATIRNAMQQLEEMGYLDHPHTSAGRIPTEAGYRIYVDELMEPESIPASIRASVAAAFRPHLTSGDVFSPEIPRILARATRQLAIVAVRAETERVLDRVDLVALEDGLLVLVIRESGGRLATSSWVPSAWPASSALRRAERWIRGALPLRGAAGARALAERARAELSQADAPLVLEALSLAAQLLETSEDAEVRIGGADHIASQPEFQAPSRLKPLVSLLAEREPLARALDALAERGRARVSIGKENAPAAMRSCSLVAVRVTSRGREGALGVMGPVRMPYRRLVSLVAYVGERLSE